MNNNNWKQQQFPNSNNNGTRTQTGNLLNEYDFPQTPQQQWLYQQDPSSSTPPMQGASHYSPTSPMPPSPQMVETAQANWQNRQQQESPWQRPPQPQRYGWVSNTLNMVRTWSGRMRAVKYGNAPQDPLVLYHPPMPTPSHPLPPRSQPWKRSRAMRVSLMMKRRRARWHDARPQTGKILTGILLALVLLLVIVGSSGSAYAYGYYQQQLPRLGQLAQLQISQTTRIYDRNWNLLYEVYDPSASGGRRTPISYQYLPGVLKDAQVAAEDATFWTNIGIDPQGILRAGASGNGGASTITQQVIKNMTHDDAQTYTRKLSEATLAIGLTRQYSKEKILEMYFNVSPYGAKELGVEAAVEDYFHIKPICDANHSNCIPAVRNLDAVVDAQGTILRHDPLLGLARASLLAGIPQQPTSFDPTLHILDNSGHPTYLARQDYVLNQMLKLQMSVAGLGPITPALIAKAEALTAKMKFTAYQHDYPHGCQHFVGWVIDQLTQQLGSSFFTNGFNIRTTIDYRLENFVEKTINQDLNTEQYQMFPQGHYALLSRDNNVHDAAVVVMDAKTGEILAMAGSTNYNDTSDPKHISGQTNMAVHPIQPGSTIKPIVYTTAFQEGWYPGMVLPDFKTFFPGYDMKKPVTDYGGDYSHTYPSVRQATASSLNIPAIKTSLYAGVANVVNMGRRMGITTLTKTDESDTSFALGTAAIPLYQMVGAYQVLANAGKRIPPQSVLDIWDNYGHHLYHYDPTHPQEIYVMSPQIAYMMTSVLSDEAARRAEFGQDHDLSFYDWDPTFNVHQVAAKTGTTEQFKDNLTLGYTPDAVVGVWAGNANNEPMNNVVGITGAAPIWHSVMERVMGQCNLDGANLPCGNFNFGFNDGTFSVPPGVSKQCVSSANGLQGSGSCDWMLDGELPMQSAVGSGPISTPSGNGNSGNGNQGN